MTTFGRTWSFRISNGSMPVLLAARTPSPARVRVRTARTPRRPIRSQEAGRSGRKFRTRVACMFPTPLAVRVQLGAGTGRRAAQRVGDRRPAREVRARVEAGAERAAAG